MFRPEINHPTNAEALTSQNLACQGTGIVYEVAEFRSPISVQQCYNCQIFGQLARNGMSKQKCLICRENRSYKGCPNREPRKPKCANCKGSHVASKVVQNTKIRHSDNMRSASKKHMPQ